MESKPTESVSAAARTVSRVEPDLVGSSGERDAFGEVDPVGGEKDPVGGEMEPVRDETFRGGSERVGLGEDPNPFEREMGPLGGETDERCS